MSTPSPELLAIVTEKGLLVVDEPVELASGQMSRHFIDAKAALADGVDLELACREIVARVAAAGIDFDVAGGLTMGADHFAHGIALVAPCKWFVVRKAPKGRGTNKRVEGAELGPGVRVLLLEDTVSTGGSIQDAYHAVAETGATVVAATTLVDRGDVAAAFFEDLGIPYLPMLTYRDLDIPPLGPAPATA